MFFLFVTWGLLIAANPQTPWLVYDIYLPSSETPPFSRQTVVAEQINAPTVCLKFQKLFCFLIKKLLQFKFNHNS